MEDKQKQTEEMENSALLVAWEFSEKEKPFVSIFIKKNDHLYIEHTSNKGEGYFILKGYRKQSEVIDEFVERLKEENEISLRRYGKGIGMTAIFKIADEMKFELFKQQEDNNG